MDVDEANETILEVDEEVECRQWLDLRRELTLQKQNTDSMERIQLGMLQNGV